MPRPRSMTGDPMEPGTGEVPTISKELAQANAPIGLDEMLRIIRGVDEFTVVSDEQMQANIVDRMLRTKSWEELVTPLDTTPTEKILGKRLTFNGAQMMASDFEESAGVYMLIDCHDGDNKLLVPCGSSNVMTILAIALYREWLPADGMIIKSEKATKSGYKPLNLVWAPPDDESF